MCPDFKQQLPISVFFNFWRASSLFIYRNDHFLNFAYVLGLRLFKLCRVKFFFNFIAATYSVHILDRVDLFGPFTQDIF